MAVSVSVSESLRSVLNDSLSGEGNEEYSITHLAEASHRNFDKIPTNQIYKKTLLSGLNFMNNYKIKSVKQSFHLRNTQHDVYLLTRDDIRRHKIKYDFLHIGLVQAYVAPLGLVPPGAGDRILVCLRDAKYPNLKDSILAAFEISMCDIVKFNWFPNFSSSLSDLANSNGLMITVEPQGNDWAKKSKDAYVFEFEYIMCYKLMKGSLEPRPQFENPMLEVNTERIKILAPKPTSRILKSGGSS